MLEWKWSMRNESFLQILGMSFDCDQCGARTGGHRPSWGSISDLLTMIKKAIKIRLEEDNEKDLAGNTRVWSTLSCEVDQPFLLQDGVLKVNFLSRTRSQPTTQLASQPEGTQVYDWWEWSCEYWGDNDSLEADEDLEKVAKNELSASDEQPCGPRWSACWTPSGGSIWTRTMIKKAIKFWGRFNSREIIGQGCVKEDNEKDLAGNTSLINFVSQGWSTFSFTGWSYEGDLLDKPASKSVRRHSGTS